MIYAGIVVGGPLDGQRVTSENHTLRVPVLRDVGPLTRPSKPDEPTNIVTFVYEYGPIYLDANTELNLWKPHGQSRVETLRLLIAGYKP